MILCTLSVLRTVPTKYGVFVPNWDHAQKVDLFAKAIGIQKEK
mgnify:CR=1 FL=1